MAIVGAIVAVYSAYQQHRANKARRKAQEVDRRVNELNAQRERRQQAEQRRIEEARARAQAQTQGVTGSSLEAGVLSGGASRFAEAQGFSAQVQTMQNQSFGFRQTALRRQSQADTATAVSNLAFTYEQYR